MFSNRIANSAKFLQMPAESQLLYFHMVLRADDDGIVESYPLMKLLGVPSDNFKVLKAKSFIRELNEDQVVVITDWTEHNTIRADRKVNSIYIGLLKECYPELPVIEPKPRSDVKDNTRRTVHGQSTDGISKVRLGKVKLSKDNNTTGKTKFSQPSLEDVLNYCDERKNGVDANVFMDFYESKGWYVGKNKMKDWRASVRTWEKRTPKKGGDRIWV